MKAYNLESAIREKEKVTHLCIHRRTLTDWPAALFSFPQLRSLELSQNGLSCLPKQLLQLKTLEEVIITDNQLSAFPAFLSQLPHLKVINLCGNSIAEWPSHHDNFHQLEQLSLSRNQLKQFPPSLEHFKNLKILDLSYNQIKMMPADIHQLHSLRKLSIQHNQLAHIPESLSSCTQLSELNLQHNRLQQLPVDIGQLDQLYRLNAAKNQLTQLPESISKCKFLSDLNLSRNKLQQLPPGLTACTQLRELKLSDNQLTTLPSPSGWRQLRKWILDGNQIQQLPEGIKDLQYLEQLSLKKNPLSGFFPELLHLSRLRQVQGLLKAVDSRLLIRFLKICRKKQIAIPERKQLYSLLNGEALPYSRKLLLKAATLGVKALREQAIQQILKQYSLPLSTYPLVKKSKAGLLGRSRLRMKELEEAFEQRGLSFSRNIDAETTHIILGSQWSEEEELPEKDFVFLREARLFKILRPEQAGYLDEAAPQQLARLRTLLCSREDSRIEIALQVLKGGGLPSSLFTEVFIAWKTAQRQRLRNELYNLLSWHVDEATRAVLSSRWSLSKKIGTEKMAVNIARYAEGTQLEEATLLSFFCDTKAKG